MSMRDDITRSATAGKAMRQVISDPTICSVCSGKPAVFVWRRRGFCRRHKTEAYAFAAATPMPTRETPP